MACNMGVAEDTGSIPGSGRAPGGGRGIPLQYSCMENHMHREAWWATCVPSVAELDTTEGIEHSTWCSNITAYLIDFEGHNEYPLTQWCPTVCVTFWTQCTHQASLSMGFSRQESWSGVPLPSLGDLPDSGIKSRSPALAGRFFTFEPPGKPRYVKWCLISLSCRTHR